MEYGITLSRDGIAEQPSPWQYLTNFARESDQMGWAYCVIGDRLESGMDFGPLGHLQDGERFYVCEVAGDSQN